MPTAKTLAGRDISLFPYVPPKFWRGTASRVYPPDFWTEIDIWELNLEMHLYFIRKILRRGYLECEGNHNFPIPLLIKEGEIT